MEFNKENVLITQGIITNMQHNTLVANARGEMTNVGINLRSGLGRPIDEFTLPKDRQKDTIFIVGPGASMSQYREQLPQLRDHGTVIMQPTAYPWMSRIGLEPDVIVAVDHLPNQAELTMSAKCPFICPTTIDEDIAKHHDTYFFVLYQGDGSPKKDGTPEGDFMAQWNLMMHHIHKQALTDTGWTSAMDVTNMSVKIAADIIAGENGMPKWGKRIVIVGADRCFWNGYSRVPWEGIEPQPFVDAPQYVDFRGQRTDYAMIFYIYALYEFWRAFPVPLYRLDHGVMKEIPFMSMDQILADNYPRPLSAKRVEQRTEEFILREFADTIPYLWASPETVAEMAKVVSQKRTHDQRYNGPEEKKSERYPK